MIFDVAYLIWHLSQYTVLEPGDLINTGTPQGVALSGRFPYLAAGDVWRSRSRACGSGSWQPPERRLGDRLGGLLGTGARHAM